MPSTELSVEDQQALRQIARASIEYALENGKPLRPDPAELSEVLLAPGACFVTLLQDGSLRGCIGSLEAVRPLAEDVAENAFAAAFRDPRFSSLSKSEWDRCEIEISVLTPAVDLPVSSEEDLVEHLVPGKHGVILKCGSRRATYLPSVWEMLPDPYQFIGELKRKAGLPREYWGADIKIEIYSAIKF